MWKRWKDPVYRRPLLFKISRSFQFKSHIWLPKEILSENKLFNNGKESKEKNFIYAVAFAWENKVLPLKQTFKDYPYLTVNVHLVKTSTFEEEFKKFEVFLALQTLVQWIDYSN